MVRLFSSTFTECGGQKPFKNCVVAICERTSPSWLIAMSLAVLHTGSHLSYISLEVPKSCHPKKSGEIFPYFIFKANISVILCF